MLVSSTVIYSCGCVVLVSIDDSLKETILTLQSPDSTEKYSMKLRRIITLPSTFIELPQEDKPEWTKYCHAMTPFDINTFPEANIRAFEDLFASYYVRFGKVVPMCWLPDLLAGYGRFYGLWPKRQTTQTSKNHLRIVPRITE